MLPAGKRTSSQPYALRLQSIEADRVGAPGLSDWQKRDEAGGVRFDATTGAPKAYHLYDEHPGAWYAGAGGYGKGVWVDRVGATGLFPACAGMNRGLLPVMGLRVTVPRVRGDEPIVTLPFDAAADCSPRARG